jgi:hypothetical protein
MRRFGLPVEIRSSIPERKALYQKGFQGIPDIDMAMVCEVT